MAAAAALEVVKAEETSRGERDVQEVARVEPSAGGARERQAEPPVLPHN